MIFISINVEDLCKKHKLKLEDNDGHLLLSNKGNKIEIPLNSNMIIINGKTFYFKVMMYGDKVPSVVCDTIAGNIIKQTVKTKTKPKVVELDGTE